MRRSRRAGPAWLSRRCPGHERGAHEVDPELARSVPRPPHARLPSRLTASLRRGAGRTATIGLSPDQVSNPFSAALLRAGVEDEARRTGCKCSLGARPGPREGYPTLSTASGRLDIVPAGQDQSYLQAESRHGVRAVYLKIPRLFSSETLSWS